MRRSAALAALTLFACRESDLLPEDAILPRLPTELSIPDCVKFDPEERGGSNHVRDNDGYHESLDFIGTRQCMDAWAQSLGGEPDERGPIYFAEADRGYLMMVRISERHNPQGTKAFVQWLHQKPLEGVEYWDLRE